MQFKLAFYNSTAAYMCIRKNKFWFSSSSFSSLLESSVHLFYLMYLNSPEVKVSFLKEDLQASTALQSEVNSFGYAFLAVLVWMEFILELQQYLIDRKLVANYLDNLLIVSVIFQINK